MTDAILAGAVLAAMAALAVHDARRATIDPRLVLALLGAAAAWRFLGSGESESAWARLVGGVLGATLGVAAATVPIAVASWCGRRWPLYPGDATMLGALGFLLGVPGLAWTMLLGSGFALLYRFCVQRRRGRPFRKGLVPLAPGMCAGAAVVFLCIDCGVALADDGAVAGDGSVSVPAVTAVSLSAPDAPEGAPLPATELGPALGGLPAALAAREVVVGESEALRFPALVRRLGSLSGLKMTVEERPARIADGAATLADPPPLVVAFRGTLAGLLDRVAALSGYDWSWDGGAVVFQRYWDIEQRGPAPHQADMGAAAQADGDAREGVDSADDPAAGAARRTVGDAGVDTAGGEDGGWIVDPEKHRTLRGVLESWAARAGWTLVWKAERDYALGAAATFRGGFLEAADLLLSGPLTRRTLDVRAYEANRHLVVDDAGGGGS